MGASARSALLASLIWATYGTAAGAEGSKPAASGAVAALASSRAEAAAPASSQGAPAAPEASEAEVVGPLRVLVGARFGFGGDLRYDLAGGPTVAENLETTLGFQVGVDYVVMRYFALGGALRVGWFSTDVLEARDLGRSRLIDVVVNARARYALRRVPWELYLSVPFGLTLPAYDDPGVEEKAGWTLGVGGGVTGFFTEHLGLNLEAAGLLYFFRADLPSPVGTLETDTRLGQFTLLVNLVWAF